MTRPSVGDSSHEHSRGWPSRPDADVVASGYNDYCPTTTQRNFATLMEQTQPQPRPRTPQPDTADPGRNDKRWRSGSAPAQERWVQCHGNRRVRRRSQGTAQRRSSSNRSSANSSGGIAIPKPRPVCGPSSRGDGNSTARVHLATAQRRRRRGRRGSGPRTQERRQVKRQAREKHRDVQAPGMGLLQCQLHRLLKDWEKHAR